MTAPKVVMPSQIVMRATASLIGYARNSRTHDERQIDVLCKSITEYGFTNPILIDGDRGVIAGHGRIMAAEKLGLVEVPCIELRHLTNEQKRAYLILDNQSALMSTWSEALLAQELADLSGVGIEATDLGFDAAEVDRLMETLGVDFGGKAEGDPDAIPEAPVVPTSKLDDVWLLGKHRVMCGDSTDRAQVERLMDGQKADMVFTDPPYNVAMQRSATLKNDNLSDDDFETFLSGAFSCASMNAKQDAPWFVWIGWRAWSTCERVLSNYKTVRNCIVWAKPSIGLGQPGYRYQHEVGLFCGEIADRSASDLWIFSRDRSGLHPTMKPVELVEHGFQTAGQRGDMVLDLFGGSGSTLIACEKTNRQARLMELDPKYCDVIVKRWQEFTGQSATLDGDGRTFAEIAEARRA
jgi:DNA modification methylase